jgi:phosphatidylglycerol:prolipoprotein diacylglycerol transferase
MYLVGFASAWCLARYRAPIWQWSAEQIGDLVFYVALGVILGGRLGYMLFYDFADLLANPVSLFKIWQGGMSFHGGFLGVLLSLCCYSFSSKRPFLAITDFVAPLVPIGLGAGRLGNFINGELLGRVTDLPWAMAFPFGGPLPRHPWRASHRPPRIPQAAR